MRLPLLPIFVLIGAVLSGSAGALETRTFIIANQADGYGVDQCLSKGERCGLVVATAYCQSQHYSEAKSYRKIEPDEITGGVPPSADAVCRGACNAFAIECTR